MKKGFLRKSKRKRSSGEMALQITSMADIFMILLVFLLKSYATSVTNIAPTSHISLPEVSAKGVPKESLKIEVGKETITVDDKPVVQLRNFEFGPEETNSGDTSPAIAKALSETLKRNPSATAESSAVVMADENTPYATIKRVVASAAGAGLVDLQLLVVQTE